LGVQVPPGAQFMKKSRIILPLVIILTLVFLLGNKYISSNNSVSTNYRPEDLKKDLVNSQNLELEYEIIQKGEALGEESYLVLVSSQDAATLNQIALNIKKEECRNPCNVYLFDDRQAISTYLEYDKMMKNKNTTSEERYKWNKENYIYVADHYVGTMNYSEDSFFTSYPNRDSYYKALKEGKI
jgi:hypothetical protein